MTPVSTPAWLDALPESITEAEYRGLSEEVSRSIEIVHGHVIKRESPTPLHNRIARRLANALEAGRSPAGACLTVGTYVDVVLWRAPRFTFRRPDVAVHRRIDDPLRRPAAEGTVMVIEVTSPTTAREDLVDKRAQYAVAGIPFYLVVLLDGENEIGEIREFHMDATAVSYRLHAVHTSVLELEQPIRLTLPISDLVSG
jgi:Uma2 family endonuclease